MRKLLLFLCMGTVILFASNVFAVPVSWTDWTAATVGQPGSATGTIGGGITVDYSGDVNFFQLGTGTNYWTEGSPAPYTASALVDNAPTASEMIALSKTGMNTLFFSQPVENPLMAIVSMGQPNLGVTYDFNTPFTVLSEGLGYWGDGTYTTSAGDILTGNEFHGVLQFTGTISSISWSTFPDEYWHGITVGLAQVPEPATLLLLGLGLIGIGGFRRKA